MNRTCFSCTSTTCDGLDLWGYPICRSCAARLGLQREPAAGSCRGVEHIPPTVDTLDELLALWIAQAMLDDPHDAQEVHR